MQRARLWIVHKLVGELCVSAKAPTPPTAPRPALPCLLDRLLAMGLKEAGATRQKPGESRARSCFHVISPLDVNSRGLLLCTTSAPLALLLASRPSTLARHLSADEVFLRGSGSSSGGGGSGASTQPLLYSAAAIAASRTTIITRRYRARLGAQALAPHLVAALAAGRHDAPIYVSLGGSSSSSSSSSGSGGGGGGGGGSGGGRGSAGDRGKGPANVNVELVTSLDGKLLRAALERHGVLVSSLQRVAQGPFSLQAGGVITPGSALEVNVPSHLLRTADKLARALRGEEEESAAAAPANKVYL